MIDDHVHPFPLEHVPLAPAELTLDVHDDEAGPSRRRELAGGRLFVELLTVRLARLLGCRPDEVLEVRDALAGADWVGYVRRLLDDAEVEGMVMDGAWHPEEARPVGDYAALAGRPVWEMVRVEPVVDGLLAAGASAAEVVRAVEAAMEAGAERGCVAFKTVIAYRTGLAVDPTVTLDRAESSLARGAREGDPGGPGPVRPGPVRPGPVRRRGKALRDLVFLTMLARAADLGRPVQIHTGMGDSDIRLAEAHPLLLEDALCTPAGRAARVVLIHGSFPWHEEAAYLASTRPNVWVEASLLNLFAPLTTAERLARIVDLAPCRRILLGSDGHGAPETHWFGCRSLLEAWPEVARRLAGAGARSSFVASAHQGLFGANARELYRLPG
ncbi:MAG: amidohydrolase family protein [Acidimicrobiales bacterium]